MVNAINFAVRNSVGGRQHGTVAGEGQGNFIQVGSGDSVSLNISPSSIVAYEQQGRDLVIKLADGRIVVLSGYFDAAGGATHLYLSANDQITEVMLSGDGSGVLMANYGPTQPMEKWSPLDDLRFAEADAVVDGSAITDEPAGMGLFAPAMLGGLGGVGAAGAGLIGLGLLGGGTDTTPGGGGTDTTPGGGGTDTTPGGGGTDTTPGGGGTDTTPGGGGTDTTPGGGGTDTTPGGGGTDTTPGGGGTDTSPGGGGTDPTPGGGGTDTTPGGGGTDTTPGGGGTDT
ncbi:MAG: BapA prefix-like domain-containing protein, partial [Paracoccaceae bacterium]